MGKKEKKDKFSSEKKIIFFHKIGITISQGQPLR